MLLALPRTLRVAVMAAAVGTILWLSLSPVDTLPIPTFWDKAQHALAFLALTALGLLLSSRRRLVPWAALGLGLAIEVLQATMGFGRVGDWRDLVADAVGVLLAVGLFAVAQRLLPETA